MAVNKHFHSSNYQAIASEQSLVADLVAEAIQIHGHDVYYLDRTLVAEDTVFGTDALSKYQTHRSPPSASDTPTQMIEPAHRSDRHHRVPKHGAH